MRFTVMASRSPSVAHARRIRAPYQWHHGLLDYAVPFLLDRRFDSVLEAPHEGHLYRRLRHAEVATDPEVLSRVRAWYTPTGCSSLGTAALHCAMRRERRTWEVWLVAAGVAATTAGMLVAAEAPPPPRLMADVLRARAEWRLLDPTTDLVSDLTRSSDSKKLDSWPSCIELDFDRDGLDDIAAVVVRRGTGNVSEFTVVVVHGGTPGRAELVVPFRASRFRRVGRASRTTR